MEKNQELEQLQLQMQNLLKNIKAKEEHIALLETLPTIKKYNAYLYDREKLQEEYEQKKEEYEIILQDNCPHPLHYFKVDSTYFDDFDRGFVVIYRECLRCMFKKKREEVIELSTWEKEKDSLIYEATPLGAYPNYSGCKQIEIPYNKIRQEFLELESEGYSFEQIREILHSKYTEKNEDLARNLKMKYIPKQRK